MNKKSVSIEAQVAYSDFNFYSSVIKVTMVSAQSKNCCDSTLPIRHPIIKL